MFCKAWKEASVTLASSITQGDGMGGTADGFRRAAGAGFRWPEDGWGCEEDAGSWKYKLLS